MIVLPNLSQLTVACTQAALESLKLGDETGMAEAKEMAPVEHAEVKEVASTGAAFERTVEDCAQHLVGLVQRAEECRSDKTSDAWNETWRTMVKLFTVDPNAAKYKSAITTWVKSDAFGTTCALRAAALHLLPSYVDFFCDRQEADVDAKDGEGFTALGELLRKEADRMWCGGGTAKLAERDWDAERQGVEVGAADAAVVSMAQRLLYHGADVHAAVPELPAGAKGEASKTAVVYAAVMGNEELLRDLMEDAGVAYKWMDRDGVGMLEAIDQPVSMLRTMLELGAHADGMYREDDHCYSVERGQLEITPYEWDDVEAGYRGGPLRKACREGKLQHAQALIEAGAQAHGFMLCGDTLLHDAVKSGWPKLVGLLMEGGAAADLETADVCGKTPRESAIEALPLVYDGMKEEWAQVIEALGGGEQRSAREVG